MTRYNVIMTSPRLAAAAVAILEAAGCAIHYMEPYPSADDVTALTAATQADAILSRQGPVNAACMDASPRLRIVARHGVGVDDVDIPAAAARNILVTRAPGSNKQAVAEHTMALLLALAKDLRPLATAIAAGHWRGATTKVRDIAGMRLGLLGYGPIAQAVVPLATAFGMAVGAYDPGKPAGTFGATRRHMTLLDLFANSDALSVHCPLSPETRHIVNAATLAGLPPGSYVVNTARGGIIDEAALAAALDTGHIAGAGLDVFEEDPPRAHHPLRNHPRVLPTPHVAGVTDGSLISMGVMAAECIAAVLTGHPPPPDRIVRA